MNMKFDLIKKIVDKKMEKMKEMSCATCQHGCHSVPCAGQCGV